MVHKFYTRYLLTTRQKFISRARRPSVAVAKKADMMIITISMYAVCTTCYRPIVVHSATIDSACDCAKRHNVTMRVSMTVFIRRIKFTAICHIVKSACRAWRNRGARTKPSVDSSTYTSCTNHDRQTISHIIDYRSFWTNQWNQHFSYVHSNSDCTVTVD